MDSTGTVWEQDGHLAILRLCGFIDQSSEQALLSQYGSLPDDTKQILLDFTHVQRMDSSGVGLLISLWSLASEAHREVVWFGMSEGIMRVLTLLRVPAVIRMCRTEAEARALLSAGQG